MGHPEGSPLRGPATSLLWIRLGDWALGGHMGQGVAGQASWARRTPPWAAPNPLVPPRKLGGKVPPHPTINRGAWGGRK